MADMRISLDGMTLPQRFMFAEVGKRGAEMGRRFKECFGTKEDK